jgi:hypothetical protein
MLLSLLYAMRFRQRLLPATPREMLTPFRFQHFAPNRLVFSFSLLTPCPPRR